MSDLDELLRATRVRMEILDRYIIEARALCETNTVVGRIRLVKRISMELTLAEDPSIWTPIRRKSGKA